MKRLNAELSDQVKRQVAYAWIARYAAVAVGWPEGEALDDWQVGIGEALRIVLTEVAGGQWSSDDVRFLAEIESRTLDYLEKFDEEPNGAGYYPYSAIMLVLIGLPILVGSDPEAKAVNSLWEYSKRFSGHVDWELRNSRILTDSPNIFEKREELLWLRTSRLHDAANEEFAALFHASRELATECLEVLSLAFREEATSDYVVIFDDINRPSLEDVLQRKKGDLRVTFGDSIYIDRMDDANRTYFERPAYVFVWGQGVVLADFLREVGDIRTLVDPRRPDGMVIEGASFVENPVASASSW